MTVYWQHRHYRAIRQPELKELLRPRLQRFQLSPTQVNTFTDTSAEGPMMVFAQNLLYFPKAPSVSGQFGSAMHETLDWIFRQFKAKGQVPSEAGVLAAFEKRLKLKRLGEPHESLLIERGRGALIAYLRQRAGKLHKQDFSEYNFRNEGVFIGDAHLSGKIDRLVVDPATKSLTIVDFKTGKAHRRWTNDLKLHAYMQQLYMYKILVERSNSFRGYTVSGAYLEFIEPDQDGQIRQLHLEFDSLKQQQIETLVTSIWQHIMNLNFPDVSAYSHDIKGVEAFQADLRDNKI